MIRSIWFLILVAIISLIAVLVSDNPGAVTLNWLGYKVDTSVGILLSSILFISIFFTVIYRIWDFTKNAPKRVGKAHHDWRRKRGYKALTQGMVAVAAGDAQEARRQARKAENFLADPPLTMLLSAQAAQLSGDEKAASKFFSKMSERKDTKYLGIHGMLNQAIQDGDKVVALELAEQANDLHPKTDKVSKALFELQVQSGNWIEAEETVRKAIKDKYLDIDIGRRRRAVIFYQRSKEAESNGNLNEALSLAKKANNLTPGFVPAAVRMAQLLRGAGKRRKAVSIIEEIWVNNPHPLLIDVIGELSSGTGAQEKMRTVEKLASYNKDHLESHLAIARFALAAGMWREAREHLNAASADFQVEVLPARICRYMAELEERENHDLELSREWLKKAAIAEPDSAWNCNHCGQVAADWDPLCKHCENFDSLEWRTPPRVTRMPQADKDVYTSNSKDKDKPVEDPATTIDIKPNASS